jgi:hypothetical protein
MKLFTAQMLASAAGKSTRTIRYHVQQKWLNPEPKTAGVRGHRFSERIAKRWLGLHYPSKKLPD